MLTPEELKLEAWTWSFSKFSKFQECHEFYRLKYLEQLKVPPLTEMPFFQGRLAHKVGERAFGLLQKGEATSMTVAWDLLEPAFREFANGLPWKDLADLDKAWLEAQHMMGNYLSMLRDFGLDQPGVRCEHWFGTYQEPLIRPSGLRWVGAIDWLKIQGDRAWIYDAKTSQSMRYLDRRQLVMYAAAVEQQFGVKVEVVGYLMLRNEKPKLYEVTAQEIAELEAEMLRASEAAERGEFSVKPSMQQCSGCAYSNGLCGPFKGWIMNGNATRGEVDW